MKKNKFKIIIFFIIFLLGVGVGIFLDKKILEKKCDLDNNAVPKVLEQIKSVENSENVEDKKKALQDAYTEMENLVQKELDLESEVMKLEADINNAIELNESDSNEEVENPKSTEEIIESENETENKVDVNTNEKEEN